MKLFNLAVFYVFTFIMATNSFASVSCSDLFSQNDTPIIAGLLPAPKSKTPVLIEKIPSNSNRVELKQYTNSLQTEKLYIEELGFSQDIKKSTLELLKLLTQNSSYVLEEKNVLTKGELSIGIPIRDGYYFEVTYKSISNQHSQFVADKISLRTPTGKGSKKIAENIIDEREFKIQNSVYELGDVLGEGINAKIKIPLKIDGQLLRNIDHLSHFFEYFRKDELRDLVHSNSLLKIRTAFEYRRAKHIFLKVLFKEPMKAAIGIGFIVLASNFSANPIKIFHYENTTKNTTQAEQMLPTTAYLQDKINHYSIPENAFALRAEIVELNKQILTTFNENRTYNGPGINELSVDHSTAFSKKHQTWIFDKVDPYNDSVHTYIIFAQDKQSNLGPGIQYMALEINAKKFPELIQFIKSQGQIQKTVPAEASKI